QIILSRPTVAAMTRNQIPGISSTHLGEFHAEASWGYGWAVHSKENWAYMPSLCAPGTFYHGGNGTLQLSLDPGNDLVCCYFSVNMTPGINAYVGTRIDLFINAVTAAIEE